jgi:hypothetical protein
MARDPRWGELGNLWRPYLSVFIDVLIHITDQAGALMAGGVQACADCA